MTTARSLAAAAAVLLALLLQVSLFPHVAWQGVVPNLALLVVVGAALTRGPQFAMVVGFAAGALIDLAPPADHVAGRWALALTVVGYVAGRVRAESSPTATTVVGTVAASSLFSLSRPSHRSLWLRFALRSCAITTCNCSCSFSLSFRAFSALAALAMASSLSFRSISSPSPASLALETAADNSSCRAATRSSRRRTCCLS